MSPAASIASGIRRVNRAPVVLFTMWALTVAAGLPLMLAVRTAIEQQLGPTEQAGRAAAGVSYDWMSEFSDQATGVAATFGPSVIGFATVLDNASAFVDGASRPVVITVTALGYLLAWTFLAGGIIDRYARNEATYSTGFFRACGAHFPPLLRLGVVSAAVYGALLGSFHSWLLDDTFERLTRDVAVERTAFLIRLSLYAVFLGVVGGVNLLFDFAKVRLVAEGRYSALGALRAAVRFVVRHRWGAVGLYLGNVGIFVLILAMYAGVAPGAGAAGWSMWAGVAISQAYIASRLWAKLVVWGSETVYFLDGA